MHTDMASALGFGRIISEVALRKEEERLALERSATALDKRIGRRVRARRLEIGMSQERLAEVLGVTFQQVQKYEKGVNRIAASRLFDIAAALDMPVAQFFAPATEQADDVAELLATAQGAELISLFASLKAPDRARVLKLVRQLAGK